MISGFIFGWFYYTWFLFWLVYPFQKKRNIIQAISEWGQERIIGLPGRDVCRGAVGAHWFVVVVVFRLQTAKTRSHDRFKKCYRYRIAWNFGAHLLRGVILLDGIKIRIIYNKISKILKYKKFSFENWILLESSKDHFSKIGFCIFIKTYDI